MENNNAIARRDRGEAQFTEWDEADLRAFFATELPPVPGSVSSFGAMLAQRAASRVRDSQEQPTPFLVKGDGSTSGAAWTDVLSCSATGHAAHPGDAEDALAAYVDARAAHSRMALVLSRLTDEEREALSSQYGPRAVLPRGQRRAAGAKEAQAQTGGRLARAQRHYARARTETARWP